MLELLDHMDTRLVLVVNGLHAPWLDRVMWAISSRATWWVVGAGLLVAAVARFRWRGLLFVAATALVAALADLISVHAFKEVFQRLRPTHDPEIRELVRVVNDYRGGRYGFVSGHAATSFGVATFFARVGRRLWLTVVVFFCAALVAYSRVYLGVHYPGDIAGGALLGVACGTVVYLAHQRLDQRTWPDRGTGPGDARSGES